MHEYKHVLIDNRIVCFSKTNAREENLRPEYWCVDCAVKQLNQTKLERVCQMCNVVEAGMIAVLLFCILLGAFVLVTAFGLI